MPPSPRPWRLGQPALVALGLAWALFAGLLGGCATTLTPIYPSQDVTSSTVQTPGVRFSPEAVTFSEPGIPISTGNLWKRDVAVFAADRLNTLVGAAPGAPVVRTTVTFEMYGPTAFQVGSWKEMTVRLTSQLPDGRVVESAPKSAYIDSNLEYIAQQVLLFSGPIVEVGAFVFGIYLFSAGIAYLTNPIFCGCLLALAFSGLALNLAQAGLQYVVAVLEERRTSDLFLDALTAHAADVHTAITVGVLPLRQTPAAPTGEEGPGVAPPSPASPLLPLEPAPPPPDLLDDPADLDPLDTPAAPPSTPDAAAGSTGSAQIEAPPPAEAGAAPDEAEAPAVDPAPPAPEPPPEPAGAAAAPPDAFRY